MPATSLKLYIDIIKTLMEHGPLSIRELKPFLKVDMVSLKEHMSFLADQGIIREKAGNLIATYVITKRGSEILKFFKIQTSIEMRVGKSSTL